MSLSTNEIEHQAEAHRANVSELIDELRARVTPGEVVDQVLGWEEGHEIARNFGRQIKNNPLPLALISTGVAWLMIADGLQRRNGTYDGASSGNATDGARESIDRAGNAVAAAADSVGSKARAARETMSETAGNVAQSAKETLSRGQQNISDAADAAHGMYQRTRDSANAASESVSQTATSAWQKTASLTQSATDNVKQAGSSVGQMAREQPLLMGGLGFVLGVALGAIIPATGAENAVLGEQSDAMKRKAGELANQGYEKAKTVAARSHDAAAEAAKSEAENQGLTESSDETAQPGPDDGTPSGDASQPDGGNDGRDYASGTYPHH